MAKHSPILILGMHRSGTSCLAGSLEEAGLFLGEVNSQAKFNNKGNRENKVAMQLHDQILTRKNATWSTPPALNPTWTQDELSSLKKLIQAFPNNIQWGLKDPRILFMLDGWIQLTTPQFVGTFRHPLEVAASLIHRADKWNQPMSMQSALNLWRTYNERMLSCYAAQKFDILRYDIPLKDYHQKLEHICDNFGLNMQGTPSFRETKLHNQNSHNAPIPAHLKIIWEELNDIAL